MQKPVLDIQDSALEIISEVERIIALVEAGKEDVYISLYTLCFYKVQCSHCFCRVDIVQGDYGAAVGCYLSDVVNKSKPLEECFGKYTAYQFILGLLKERRDYVRKFTE